MYYKLCLTIIVPENFGKHSISERREGRGGGARLDLLAGCTFYMYIRWFSLLPTNCTHCTLHILAQWIAELMSTDCSTQFKLD